VPRTEDEEVDENGDDIENGTVVEIEPTED